MTHQANVRLKSTAELLASGPVDVETKDGMWEVGERAADTAMTLLICGGGNPRDFEECPAMYIDWGPVLQ